MTTDRGEPVPPAGHLEFPSKVETPFAICFTTPRPGPGLPRLCKTHVPNPSKTPCCVRNKRLTFEAESARYPLAESSRGWASASGTPLCQRSPARRRGSVRCGRPDPAAGPAGSRATPWLARRCRNALSLGTGGGYLSVFVSHTSLSLSLSLSLSFTLSIRLSLSLSFSLPLSLSLLSLSQACTASRIGAPSGSRALRLGPRIRVRLGQARNPFPRHAGPGNHRPCDSPALAAGLRAGRHGPAREGENSQRNRGLGSVGTLSLGLSPPG